MTATPTATLHEGFSTPGAVARPWAEVEAALGRAEISWLSTVRRDGRPHVTPLPAIWLDGALHFCTGPDEQKARNLAANQRCVLTTGSDRLREGLDVVVEGVARRVVDRPTLERLAERWQAELDWPYDVVEGGFAHPGGTGGTVVLVYAVRPDKVLAFGKGEPFSQTRYTF